MKIVLFLLDAFRYDYISKENTPFLWDCSQKGKYIKHIIPSAGFCERTEIFSGLEPDESGFFTAIGFDPIKSPYKVNLFLKLFGIIEDLINNIFNSQSKVARIFRIISLKILRKLFNRKRLKPYNIPFSYLRYFNLTEDEYDFRKIEYPNRLSTFQLVDKLEKKTYFNCFINCFIKQTI